MATTYFNCPVFLTTNSDISTSAMYVVAQSASIEESIPLLPIKTLGRSGPQAVVADDTRVGTINLSFVVNVKNDSSLLQLSDILGWMPINSTSYTNLYGQVGSTRFRKAIVTNLTVESSALSVARATLTLQYYCSKDADAGAGVAGALDSLGTETEQDLSAARYAQGIQSIVNNGSNVGISTNHFSFNLNVSANPQPIKIIGDIDPESIIKTDGSATMTLVGNNLPNALYDEDKASDGDDRLCIDSATTIGFTLQGCEGADTYTLSLPLTSLANDDIHISNRQISVSENGVLEGTATIVQYF